MKIHELMDLLHEYEDLNADVWVKYREIEGVYLTIVDDEPIVIIH